MLRSLAAFTFLCSSALAQAPTADLLKDIHTIAAPGSPGVVLSLKETITPIVLGGLDRNTMGPVIVAGTWGKGRIVAFGHSGYIHKDNLKGADASLLMERLLRWAGGGPGGGGQSKPLPVAVIDGDMNDWLNDKGWNPSKLDAASITADALRPYALVIVGEHDLTDAQRAALGTWVQSGGGLIAAQTGWGWQQIHGGPDMRTNGLNKLLLDAGVAWTDEIIDKTTKDGFDVTKAADGPVTLTAALGLLVIAEEHGLADDKTSQAAQLQRLGQASAIVSRGVRILPETDQTTRPKLAALLKQHEAELVPTEKTPLDGKRPLLRTLMALQLDAVNALPPEQVRAHPAAATFPGAVPPETEAPRLTRTVFIDTRIPRWHSVGLYAPAGEVITIHVPQDAKDLSVRIGCHTDNLWHLPTWKRIPQLTLDKPLKPGENTIASAFGGLLYIDVDKPSNADRLRVSISGCVAAPLFILGKTKPEDWKSSLRSAPGPWAEFQTPSVIITVPSSAIRTLDDPTELCTTWQQVLDNAADLGGTPHQRKSPERYVPDVQISAGYMHSGYPIMTHLDAVDEMSQAAKLKAGSWGLFHELGHNHQKSEWTFDGTGEVTNNLWSLYLMETIAGKKPGRGHDAMDSEAKRREKALKHIQTGADFAKWKSDPFLALEMYYELREAFGWEPFKKVFAEYQTLKPSERPKNDQEERDQWMVRMSRAVGGMGESGRNLGPFFEKWGVPTTQAARDSIKDLPVWMPEFLSEPRPSGSGPSGK